jgi:hypothetical protein
MKRPTDLVLEAGKLVDRPLVVPRLELAVDVPDLGVLAQPPSQPISVESSPAGDAHDD